MERIRAKVQSMVMVGELAPQLGRKVDSRQSQRFRTGQVRRRQGGSKFCRGGDGVWQVDVLWSEEPNGQKDNGNEQEQLR